MDDSASGTESAQLKACIEKIQREARASGKWEIQFLKLETARLKSDGSIEVEASRRLSAELMAPALSDLSQRVGFSITASHEEMPAKAVSPNTLGVRTGKDEYPQPKFETPAQCLTPDGRCEHETPTQVESEPVLQEPRESKPFQEGTWRRQSGKVKHLGVPENIRACVSFANLPPNAKGLLKLMYGHSSFDRMNARRVCEVSRNGLAAQLKVAPRTATNLMRELRRLSLVKRLKRGYPGVGISVYELPVSIRHVHLWRMEKAGKGRY